jgi:cell division protein FtsL
VNRLKTKIRRLVYRVKKDYLTLSNMLLVVALVFCASWAWGSITAMSRNWELEQKVSERRLEQRRLELEVENLILEQEYYKTEEYQELVARSKQGKMLEGETMVILPENSEGAINKYDRKESADLEKKSNFEQWMVFLFG